MLHQTGTNRIFQDIGDGEAEVVCVTDDVIVEAFLPDTLEAKTAKNRGGISFENADER